MVFIQQHKTFLEFESETLKLYGTKGRIQSRKNAATGGHKKDAEKPLEPEPYDNHRKQVDS